MHFPVECHDKNQSPTTPFFTFNNKSHGFLILQPSNFIRDVAANTFNKSINLGRVSQVYINMAFGKVI